MMHQLFDKTEKDEQAMLSETTAKSCAWDGWTQFYAAVQTGLEAVLQEVT